MRVRFRSLKFGNTMVLAAASLLWWPDAGNAQLLLVPWVPPAVSISNHIVAGMVWMDVRVWLPDTCKRLGGWGTLVQTLPTITVNSTCWNATGIPCGNVVLSTNHSYQLGYLAPGNYQFVFEAWGQTVATQAFAVPATDSDGDGMPDYQEWIAGTDPWNSNSALRMLGYKVEGGQARVTWQGGTSARQYVERRANLNGTNSAWLCIFTNYPPTPATNTWVEPLGANAAQFYRIRVEK
jgi:hypothetical protein